MPDARQQPEGGDQPVGFSPKGASRRLVSTDQLRLPSPTNKAVNPIRRSSGGPRSHEPQRPNMFSWARQAYHSPTEGIMKQTIYFLLLLAATIGSWAAKTAAQSGACAPTSGLNFICGLQAPEDLVLVPNTRWLIASGMVAGSGLHLIDTQAKSARTLFGVGSSPARADKTKFATCSGPLDPKQAVLHGLSLRPAQGSRYTLYA